MHRFGNSCRFYHTAVVNSSALNLKPKLLLIILPLNIGFNGHLKHSFCHTHTDTLTLPTRPHPQAAAPPLGYLKEVLIEAVKLIVLQVQVLQSIEAA